jgi:hypothetical protein
MAEDIEAELQAMKTLVETLEPLKAEVRSRVIDYAFKVLGIEPPHDASKLGSAAMAQLPPLTQPPPTPTPTHHALHPRGTGVTDIQSPKEAKDPKTATQMVAVVAYYLAHIANPPQNLITAEDVETYFRQGRYPMPGSKPQALINTKRAGYLEQIEPGKYRLNSVGFNLVEHKMPKGAGGASSKPRRKNKPAKKSAKKSKR